MAGELLCETRKNVLWLTLNRPRCTTPSMLQ